MSDKKYGDERSYAILKDEWETQREIDYYYTLPIKFDGFVDLPELSDGVIHLVCTAKNPGNPEKKEIRGYDFAVFKGSEKIGGAVLHTEYSDHIYYRGQIGYDIDEKYRGNGYAVRACRLLAPVARAHGMTKVLITNYTTNTASRRVCEKLGARLLRVARLPEWHDLHEKEVRFLNIYEWDVE